MERVIKRLQELFSRLGYLTLRVRAGELDGPPCAALHRFQQLHALDPTPEPDDHTWEHLGAVDKLGECVVTRYTQSDRRGAGPRQRRALGAGAEPADADGRFGIGYGTEAALRCDRVVEGRKAVADLVFDLRGALGRINRKRNPSAPRSSPNGKNSSNRDSHCMP